MQLRVFELAKQMGKKPEDIREELKKRAVEVKSNLSLVPAKVAQEILAALTQAKADAASRLEKFEKKAAVLKPAVLGSAPGGVVHVPAKPILVKAKPAAPKPEEAAKPAPSTSSGQLSPSPAASAPAASAPVPPRVLTSPVAKPAPLGIGAPKAPAGKPQFRRPDARPGGYRPGGRPQPRQAPPPPKPAPKEVAPAPVPAADGAEAAPVEKKPLKLPESVTVAELADYMAVKPVDVIRKLMDYKVMATINQRLAKDVAQTVALDFGFETEIMGLFGEDLLEKEEADDPANVVTRPPVVTIMGHVDHGKTSLLDAIRSTNVVSGEAGGITQHIGAYKVTLPGKGDVVFLDTPGHAAFTSMRARGAAVTDVVVLVVAADDGVMPQTIEAIDHAKAAGVPIVVAVNKIDKEGAKPDRVMQELSKYNLVPEEWGGKTIFAQISAKKKIGLDKLLELLVLESELLELKADPKRRGKGVIIEAKLDKGRGTVATVLVQKGTVRVGDIFVTGNYSGRVRALINDQGKKIDEAGPSTPVEILGLSGLPAAGDGFQVVENERLARQISAKRLEVQKERERQAASHIQLDDLFHQIQSGDLKELKIILKADVTGSAEAIKDSLEKIESSKVKVRVIHAGVGNLNETDIMLAAASNAIVLGFHVKADSKAADVAKSERVDVRLYEVIYDLVNDVRTAMEGLLEPHYNEVTAGKGELRGVFKTSAGVIAGTYITSGKVTRGINARLTRAGEKVWEGKVDSLKRFKDDAKEVGTGMECGIGLHNPPVDMAVGDQLEFFTLEAVAQKL
jgi:translation initiation factor IF-2